MINFLVPSEINKMMIKNLGLLPTPASISSMWNLGFLLGVMLIHQILTGVFLAIHYCGDTSIAFTSIISIMQEVNGGWETRVFHANGASMFFVCIYLHVARGFYYGSYFFKKTWFTGLTIMIMVMASAFMGYVLPWGQMSFWGATVITNLFSAIPSLGENIVIWMWGGFAVDSATLTRFFTFHFLVPFIIVGLVLAHLFFLHETGSSNPLGLGLSDKVPFHPYFLIKDISALTFMFMVLASLSFFNPWILGDPENFIPANPLITPIHIQPEWYFLFAYAILRSIPNKLGGVIALAFSIVICYTVSLWPQTCFKSSNFSPGIKYWFWSLIFIFILLTWIGARPVEAPYILIGQMLTLFYFLCFLVGPQIKNKEETLLFSSISHYMI